MALSGKPHIARRWALFLVGGLALSSVACGAVRPFAEARMSTPLQLQQMRAATEPTERFETALLARVNADRAAHGLRALAFDTELVAAARMRAAAQRPGEALSHTAPAGSVAATATATTGLAAGSAPLAFQRLLKEAGVRYAVAGENLARPRVPKAADAGETAAAAQRALMASETHRQNILDPSFDRMAVGATRGADGQIVFAQLFRGT